MEMDRWIRHVNQKAMPEEDAKDAHSRLEWLDGTP